MRGDILYRFFEGKATLSEERQILRWINDSKINGEKFNEERAMYDALLLHSITKSSNRSLKRDRKISLSPWIAGTAAAVILVLLISTLFLIYKKDESLQYNTVIVPPEQRINLILSDNTNLWLNANTRFRYPTEFAKGARTVFLDGEAYFEVSENVKKPFIVKTGQGDVRVTGTSFNVEAYSQHGSFSTSLFDGGVDIYKNDAKLVSLLPNQKSSLENNQLLISKITDQDKYLWRDGLIAFKDKELEEILRTLEKYFAVDIQIDTDKLPEHTYTGKFRQSDEVDYALRVLQRSIRFTYERDNETGTVYIN